MMEKYYSAQETMAILGISYTTLWREVKAEKLAVTYAGRNRRFAESAIIRYLERKKAV
jgi:predicted DNA-binding transcriptional regulator AlpA